ncbi:hypothetical protein IF2G_10548 [Cordyceps javanica]|nr:hypothetical protein IF2G_10548 [Cordyceps javanica]
MFTLPDSSSSSITSSHLVAELAIGSAQAVAVEAAFPAAGHAEIGYGGLLAIEAVAQANATLDELVAEGLGLHVESCTCQRLYWNHR